jgi:TubC N-terminal docking domain
MILDSPSVMQLLADLADQGIGVEPTGSTIRFRPRHAMTPALIQQLRVNKTELMRFLDTEAVVAELRQSIKCLREDPTWRSAWERRFERARYADFASLQRALDLVIDQATELHRRHDWKEFASVCLYLYRLASGEFWDQAEQTAAKFHSI